MSDRMAQERRHSEFSSRMSPELFPAAVGILGRAGWRWQNDTVKAYHGWWTRIGGENSRPLGDPGEIGFAAYKTIQLYTDIEMDVVIGRAAELRREETARLYSNKS